MACRYTEHTIKLPDGIEIFYSDSGPVPGSKDYTTLVTFHGSAFNGEGLVRLHDHAHTNNLRVINWNRRGYRGSTKYSESELEDLRAGHKTFLDKLAMQIAWFLEHLVKVENVPRPVEGLDRKKGGIVILGWSFGNATSLISFDFDCFSFAISKTHLELHTLLSDPDLIPKTLYETIEPYLLSAVLYDPPFLALGYPDPDCNDVYNPLTDPDHTTPEMVAENFRIWASSYYSHPNIPSLKCNKENLDFRKHSETCTFNAWTEEQQGSWFDLPAAVQTELPAFAPGPPRQILAQQTENVIYDDKIFSTFFPNVNLILIATGYTSWHSVLGYQETLRRYNQAVSDGKKVRPMNFALLEHGNHFIHYDYPDTLLEYVIDGMRK